MRKIFVNWHILLLCVFMSLLSMISWYSSINPIVNTVSDSAPVKGPETVDVILKNIDDSFTGSVYRKNLFSKADNVFSYITTGEITASQVLKGSDDWLFYDTKTDGNTIADYSGTNSYSENDLEEITDAVLKTQEYFEEQGIDFVLLIPPNKENVYPRYMPRMIEHTERTRTDGLVEYMESHGVNVISPKERLIEKSFVYDVYYRYDTHWNRAGGNIAVEMVAEKLGYQVTETVDSDIKEFSFRETGRYEIGDDLAKMAGLKPFFDDEVGYDIKGLPELDWKRAQEESGTDTLCSFVNDGAEYEREVLIIGDSFRSAMIPSFAGIFRKVTVADRRFHSADLFENDLPDIVVVEYVERYSGSIKNITELIKK